MSTSDNSRKITAQADPADGSRLLRDDMFWLYFLNRGTPLEITKAKSKMHYCETKSCIL